MAAASVDVWWAAPAAAGDRHVALLDEAEVGRRRAFRRPADAARFTAAAALLRLVAGSAIGVAAHDVQVDRSCPSCSRAHGRPRLPGTGLHASLSHAGDRVAVALTEAGPVGVDVEEVGAVAEGMTRWVVAPAEGFDLADGPAFFVHWARKEAVLKATGEGLTTPMTDLVLGPPDEPPRLVRLRTAPGLVAGMADLAPGDGYVACVAVLGVRTVDPSEHDGTAVLMGGGPSGL